MSHNPHRKELIKLLQQNAYRHDLHNVWADFVALGALSFSRFDLRQADNREAEYMRIIKKYNQEEAMRFAHALGSLVEAMEVAQFDDILGSVFMEMELGSKWGGQFFTPYPVCYMMAQMHVDDRMRELVQRYGYVTANDPCVGGGAMPIALAQAMFDAKINPQQHLHITGQDVDIKAVHMAYLQLSLLHIPAIVIHGNTLKLETLSVWYTPAHILGGWSFKLNAKPAEQAESVEQLQPVSSIQLIHQTSLFEEAA